MASRRSSRLQGRQAIEPATPVSAPERTAQPVKRKASAAKAKDSTPPKAKKAKVSKASASNKQQNSKKPAAQAQLSSKSENLSVLPPEIFDIILDMIVDPPTIGKMARTCKTYYAIMIPRLHKRLAVTAMFHAHIQKLIQSTEPYLSTSQKKDLKKQGKYKGQQDKYSSPLGDKEVPDCASFVQQMIVGVCDPGRKHEYIVRAYLDEVFKNMKNLRIVETLLMTKPMAQSLASMKYLQALSIDSNKFDEDAAPPLKKIKDLKHLSVMENTFSGFDDRDLIPQLILNSKNTLRSLILRTRCYDQAGAAKTVTNGPQFPALRSLSLGGTSFDTDFTKWLKNSIDFMNLRELYLESLQEGRSSFFGHLASLAASSAPSGISLRSLYLDLSDEYHGTPESNQLDLDAKIRFLSSFDTLTSLELNNYNQHKINITTNPGLPNSLLNAILKHEALNTLKISYYGIISGCKVPCITAATLANIIDNLPQLEEIQFAPELDELDEIGRVLARGANLKSITCYPDDRPGFPPSPGPAEKILTSILQGFLSHNGDGNKGEEKYVWENHTKLREVSVIYRTWKIASKFVGKLRKGAKKPEKVKSEGDGKWEVMYSDVSGTVPIAVNVGFDPTHPWVEKVAKDID